MRYDHSLEVRCLGSLADSGRVAICNREKIFFVIAMGICVLADTQAVRLV